eukprot:183322-Chlamydomonas_euryale.AAC.3
MTPNRPRVPTSTLDVGQTFQVMRTPSASSSWENSSSLLGVTDVPHEWLRPGSPVCRAAATRLRPRNTIRAVPPTSLHGRDYAAGCGSAATRDSPGHRALFHTRPWSLGRSPVATPFCHCNAVSPKPD